MQRVDVDRPQPSMPAFTEGSVLPPYEPIRFPVNINALEKLAQTDPAACIFYAFLSPEPSYQGLLDFLDNGGNFFKRRLPHDQFDRNPELNKIVNSYLQRALDENSINGTKRIVQSPLYHDIAEICQYILQKTETPQDSPHLTPIKRAQLERQAIETVQLRYPTVHKIQNDWQASRDLSREMWRLELQTHSTTSEDVLPENLRQTLVDRIDEITGQAIYDYTVPLWREQEFMTGRFTGKKDRWKQPIAVPIRPLSKEEFASLHIVPKWDYSKIGYNLFIEFRDTNGKQVPVCFKEPREDDNHLFFWLRSLAPLEKKDIFKNYLRESDMSYLSGFYTNALYGSFWISHVPRLRRALQENNFIEWKTLAEEFITSLPEKAYDIAVGIRYGDFYTFIKFIYDSVGPDTLVRRELAARQMGLPNICDAVPENYCPKEKSSESSIAYLPTDLTVTKNDSKKEYEAKLAISAFFVSMPQSWLAKDQALDFPTNEEHAKGKWQPLEFPLSGAQALDFTDITTTNPIHATHDYLALPAPTHGQMASIELINSLREPLAYGTDYILEYDAARNQYRAKLFNPIYNDSVFHIRMRFAPGDESANPNEAILIDSEAVAAVSERLAHLGYTALANNLNHALTYANGSMTTGDIARVVAKSSDYSFDTNYQPIPSDNPFIALSGFIDHTTGRLQVQCKGANTFLTAILNELLPDGCRAETISCYSLQNIKNQQAGDDPISATISQGNLHARTHIFVGEERIAVIDGTPYSLNHQDVSALPYEQEEGLSPEDERAAFLSILDESLKNIMKEPGLLAHLDRWGDKRAMEPLIDSLRLAAFIQDLSHGVEMSPGRIGGMYETYGEEINENSILTETLLSQWIETATTTLRQAIEYASTKQFIWKELPIYGDGTVVFKTLGILKTAQSLLNVAPNE